MIVLQRIKALPLITNYALDSSALNVVELLHIHAQNSTTLDMDSIHVRRNF